MKGLLQVLATVVVVGVAAFCLVGQVADLGHALDLVGQHAEAAAGR